MDVIDYFAEQMHDNYDVTELYQMTGNNNEHYYAEVSLGDTSSGIKLYDEELDQRLVMIRETIDDYIENGIEADYSDVAISSFEKLDLFLDKNGIRIEKISSVEDKTILDKWAAKWMI